jgi:hypothetical protein
MTAQPLMIPSSSDLHTNKPPTTMNIKITPAICKEIRQHARDYIGGFGMWLELGERVQGDRMYFNCLTPGDDMDGDLYDHLPWSAQPRGASDRR